MVESSKPFPHIPIRLVKEGTAESPRTGARKQNPITSSNLSNRQGHGSKLKGSALSITTDWKNDREEREKEEKPELPNARRIILKIDPHSFDPDGLKSYGIELISELENGFIIGASVTR